MNHYDEDEQYELRQMDRHAKRRQTALDAHPDCRDPDHPGCDSCEESLAIDECEECGNIIDECWCDDFDSIENNQESNDD